MSYILDALQRAEAERERGHVPGLKSQLVPPARRERATATLRPWHAVLGLALVFVMLGIWWWAGSGEVAPAASAPVIQQPEAAVVAAPAPAAPLPASTNIPERTAPQPVQPILAPPRPAPVAPAAAPVAAPAAPAAPAKGATPAAAAAPPAAPSTPPPTPPSKPAPTNKTVPSFGELTAEARAQLPAVNVSGSTFSQNPALRMLIANGKVVQEGQDIVPGLRLETIGPRSAVLNHQGLRYSIGY